MEHTDERSGDTAVVCCPDNNVLYQQDTKTCVDVLFVHPVVLYYFMSSAGNLICDRDVNRSRISRIICSAVNVFQRGKNWLYISRNRIGNQNTHTWVILLQQNVGATCRGRNRLHWDRAKIPSRTIQTPPPSWSHTAVPAVNMYPAYLGGLALIMNPHRHIFSASHFTAGHDDRFVGLVPAVVPIGSQSKHPLVGWQAALGHEARASILFDIPLCTVSTSFPLFCYVT